MQPSNPDPDFALLCACCRSCFAGSPEIGSLPAGSDPDRLIRLARRHRVEGLAYRALARQPDFPTGAVDRLAADAKAIAADNLRAAGESRRLAEAFGSAGIPLLFIKGLALGRLAYGDPFIKRAIDIDLLVPPERIAEAAAALRQLGYQPEPPTSFARIEHWHRHSKESAWLHPDGHQVDLHSRLTDRKDALAGSDPWASAEPVEIMPGHSVLTLTGVPLLAYLAVHGGASGWFRLKWLADFAGLLSSMDRDEITASWQRTEANGLGDEFGLALLLSGETMGSVVPAAVHQKVGRSRRLGLLRALARRNLLMDDEPTQRPLGTLGIHGMQLMLPTGWTSRWHEGVRQVRHALLVRNLA